MRSFMWHALAFASAMQLSGAVAQENLFQDRVAPILREHCLSCHCEEDAQGNVSFSHRETAASASLILQQITPQAGIAAMPKDGQPLTREQLQVIRQWADSGAHWPADQRLEPELDFDWWSYRPIQLPVIPEISDAWVRTPIDAFVLRRLREIGLTPSADADRRTLIRRVTYDLTGLPPSQHEVQSFVEDESPDAYERLVERLLASPAYGERWARHWLDVVKYADTCGYDKDKLRDHAWPYRDYVIRSFNQDKPYARFIQEQIAGDTLFPGQADGILGLGFLAAGPWDFIGHVEVPESKIDGKVARNLDRDDMVSNTLNTFCSLTVQCARCHHHKFDPILQDHYYALQNVFSAVDRAERVYERDSVVERRRSEINETLQPAQAALEALERQYQVAGGETLANLDKRIAQLESEVELWRPEAYGYHSQLSAQEVVEKWVEIELSTAQKVSQVVIHPCHDDFAGIGAGFGLPKELKVSVGASREALRVIMRVEPQSAGLRPLTIQYDGSQRIRLVRISATRLATRREDFNFALAEVEVLDSRGDNLARDAVVHALDSIEALPRWSRQNLTDGKWPRYQDTESANRLQRLQAQRNEIWRQIDTPELRTQRKQLQQQIRRLNGELKQLPQGKVVYAATTDFPSQGNFRATQGVPRPVHVLRRGNVQDPLAPAAIGTIPLPGLDWRFEEELEESSRRAELARWLTEEQNPFVWRSMVNRVWQYHFGQGLVSTPNDFGRMGAVPTHPELLDWLAFQFREGDQSLKDLHRLIVHSSVYRQQSDASEAYGAQMTVDASNQYLWRMNRRRLSAEETRDSILQAAGVLSRQGGGPGFYLFELERPEHSPHFEYHKFDPADARSHRRSIYRFVVRSQPDPWMTCLDCADSSQSTPRRTETLTSLQALSLMNSRFNLEMAERFADSLRSQADSIEGQVRMAYQILLQRVPTKREQERCIQYGGQHGLENLARILFNLSEFVYLD